MPALHRVAARFIALFRRRRAEQELNAELLWQWRLMTVFHVFDDEPSAMRSIAWGLRT